MSEYDLLLFVGWLGGLVLLAWRSPAGVRSPRAACAVGATIWCVLPLWEPAMRTVTYVGLTAAFLVSGLVRRPRPAVCD